MKLKNLQLFEVVFFYFHKLIDQLNFQDKDTEESKLS